MRPSSGKVNGVGVVDTSVAATLAVLLSQGESAVKVCVFGAGAIGGYLAVELARNGLHRQSG
jgi:tRNA A37 threonylcarbamoyladenosine dehydratase